MTDSAVKKMPRWAQIVSDVCSPLLLPTYAMALAMWITPLRVLPESNRLVATAMVAVLTALVPCLAIMILFRLGKVSDRALSNRRQRILPFSFVIVCYGCAAWMLHGIGAPMWLSMFFCRGGRGMSGGHDNHAMVENQRSCHRCRRYDRHGNLVCGVWARRHWRHVVAQRSDSAFRTYRKRPH